MDLQSASTLQRPDTGLTLVEAFANPRAALGLPTRTPGDGQTTLRLTLPQSAREVLAPPLEVLRFDVTDRMIEDVRGAVWYTEAKRPDLSVALVHFDSLLLSDGARWSELSPIPYLLENARSTNAQSVMHPVRIVSVDAQEVAYAYTKLWPQWSRFGFEAVYIEWYKIRQLGLIRDNHRRASELPLILQLQRLSAQANTQQPRNLQASEDFERLATLLATRAAAAGERASSYFRDLMLNRVMLPKGWRTERAWTDVSEAGARDLLRWLIEKGTNPEQRSYTALGSLVTCLLEYNVDDRSFLLRILSDYALVKDEQELARLRREYQT